MIARYILVDQVKVVAMGIMVVIVMAVRVKASGRAVKQVHSSRDSSLKGGGGGGGSLLVLCLLVMMMVMVVLCCTGRQCHVIVTDVVAMATVGAGEMSGIAIHPVCSSAPESQSRRP